MEKIPSKARKILIEKLKEYRFMDKELIEIEEKLDENSFDVNSGIKSKNKINRKVESLAIKLAENKKYQNIKAWKKLIDDIRIDYINNQFLIKSNKIGRPRLYDSSELKLKYMQKRYVECRSKKVNNEEVLTQLQLEGYDCSIRLFKKMINSFLNDLYKEAKLRNLINF